MTKGVPQDLAQDHFEFSNMLRHVAGKKSVLEIGARFGESTKQLAAVLDSPGKVVAIDLGVDPYSPGVDILTRLKRSIADVKLMQHEAHLLLGNSRDPTMVGRAGMLGPYDFCFLDGEHTYDGVKHDWLSYGPMSEIVAFHDINNDEWGVKKLWRELKPRYVTAEYIRGDWGIGVIFRKERRL